MTASAQREAPASSPAPVPVSLRWFARAIDGWGLRQIGRAGLLGTVMIALGSFGAGALPANDPTRLIPVLGLLRHGQPGLHAALALHYLGLVLVVIAWLLLGRLLLTGSTRGERASIAQLVPTSALRRMLVGWSVPLVCGMPLASSDLYSYAAQAQLARHGLDPYTTTPADLPLVDLGKFLDNVAWKWVDTPSPYGPLWVAVSKWVAALTGDHAMISVLLLRLLPFAAIALTAWLLPVLAGRYGKRADLALWLAIGNPLILVHAVGGGHNDAVMVALIVAGLVLVTRPTAGLRDLVAGVALMTLAAAVKSPGLVAVAFAVPIYLAGRAGAGELGPGRSGLRRRDWVRHCAIAAAVALPVFAVVSLVAGVGLGWARQVSSGVPVINFMSIPTMLAVGYRAAIGAEHAGTLVDATVRDFRNVGLIVSGVLLVVLWFRATRGSALKLLALALAAVVVLGPAVQPWYFSWSLTIAAVFLLAPRQLGWIAAASIALTLLTRPMGSSLEMAVYVPAVLVAVLATRALLGPVAQRSPEPEIHDEVEILDPATAGVARPNDPRSRSGVSQIRWVHRARR
ncbi:MAG TPA: polyprenol phosphomannose-dependent alpha 1,6 mannosyltransferase MptB [Jatrophihabitans sp.]|jgi:alpha-1,6-mannosyltransferase|uniref:polyprenol phosphomannose-dependent alpha 1,6 mannosyltransferase MptB n=1 Tax=Jatrophihabitans sp. TaxID=1932789 RepID=UPI002EF887AC